MAPPWRTRFWHTAVPKWEESELMAFPSPGHGPSSQSPSTSTAPVAAGSRPTHRQNGSPSRVFPSPSLSPCDGEHQLEKLQFALAVALTRGDRDRERLLREQIALLGGNNEEPGT